MAKNYRVAIETMKCKTCGNCTMWDSESVLCDIKGIIPLEDAPDKCKFYIWEEEV